MLEPQEGGAVGIKREREEEQKAGVYGAVPPPGQASSSPQQQGPAAATTSSPTPGASAVKNEEANGTSPAAKRQATGPPQLAVTNAPAPAVHQLVHQPKKPEDFRTYNVTLLVPNAAMGLLIGKGGQTRIGITNSSGAKIRVQDYLDMQEGGVERGMVLTGTWDALSKAQTLILEKLVERRKTIIRENNLEDALFADTNDPRIMIKWLIPKDNARDLIGRRGAGLDEIMNASGAKVRVGHEEELCATANERIVYITGKKAERDLAMAMVSERAGGHAQQTNPTAVTLMVPLRAVGYLLGPGGEKIKLLREVSGCRIQLQKPGEMEMGSTEIRVELDGTEEEMQRARKLLAEKVKEWQKAENFEARTAHWPEGEAVGDVPKLKAEEDTSIKMSIPFPLLGHVIGKGGMNIKDLMRGGALVKILQDEKSFTRSFDERPCILTGKPSQILEVQRQILDRMLGAPIKALEQIKPLNPPPLILPERRRDERDDRRTDYRDDRDRGGYPQPPPYGDPHAIGGAPSPALDRRPYRERREGDRRERRSAFSSYPPQQQLHQQSPSSYPYYQQQGPPPPGGQPPTPYDPYRRPPPQQPQQAYQYPYGQQPAYGAPPPATAGGYAYGQPPAPQGAAPPQPYYSAQYPSQSQQPAYPGAPAPAPIPSSNGATTAASAAGGKMSGIQETASRLLQSIDAGTSSSSSSSSKTSSQPPPPPPPGGSSSSSSSIISAYQQQPYYGYAGTPTPAPSAASSAPYSTYQQGGGQQQPAPPPPPSSSSTGTSSSSQYGMGLLGSQLLGPTSSSSSITPSATTGSSTTGRSTGQGAAAGGSSSGTTGSGGAGYATSSQQYGAYPPQQASASTYQQQPASYQQQAGEGYAQQSYGYAAAPVSYQQGEGAATGAAGGYQQGAYPSQGYQQPGAHGIQPAPSSSSSSSSNQQQRSWYR